MRKFAIADLHFGHSKILEYEEIRGKKFKSVSDMDEHLILKWNRIVNPDDHTYIVGDFSFHSAEKTTEILSRLNGKKHLIMGNHDFQYSPSKLFSMGFSSVQMELIMKLSKTVMVKMNHFPYKGDSENEKGRYAQFRPLKQDGIWLLYGHMHSKGTKINVEEKSICVSAELLNFTPINLDNILAMIQKSAKVES